MRSDLRFAASICASMLSQLRLQLPAVCCAPCSQPPSTGSLKRLMFTTHTSTHMPAITCAAKVHAQQQGVPGAGVPGGQQGEGLEGRRPALGL